MMTMKPKMMMMMMRELSAMLIMRLITMKKLKPVTVPNQVYVGFFA